MAAIQKTAYIRSRQLLAACREIPCQHCGAQDGTVVAAHSNQGQHGKGRGMKASDQYVASLCHTCHLEVDQGHRLSRDERAAIWDKAHGRTVLELMGRGLWPLDVPIPDFRRFN